MSIITFIWKNKHIKYKNGKNLMNQYLNGYMFGYKDEDIKSFYLNVYQEELQIKILEIYERNKREIFDYIEYCKNLEEYKTFIAK